MEDMIGSNRDRRRAVKACLMCMGGGRFKKLETIARKFRTTIPRLKELKKQGAGIIKRLERKINEDHRSNL